MLSQIKGPHEMKLSVVIPSHNEEGCIATTLELLTSALRNRKIPFEVVVVNDGSRDQTESILIGLKSKIPELVVVNNPAPNGFGRAVRRGLANFSGDAVAVFMADASDDPLDLIRFYDKMQESGADCVFGNRWSRDGRVIDYPWFKLTLNRLVNLFVSIIFQIRYNDVTNAFKLYRRHVVEGLQPLISPHFNLTVEMPLKAIVRGYTYEVLPNSWTNRKTGESKLKIKEMGSRYLFIIFYCLIEKWLSRGDYRVKRI